MGRAYTNRKARIEKKLTKSAMEILLQLFPKSFKRDDFSLEEGYFDGARGIVFHAEWHAWEEPDYWTGESDSYDAFHVLHSSLINETTDWDGEIQAREKHGWDHDDFDCSPYYSPWRLGDITRGQIIGHCRRLVKAGITWEPSK